MTQTSPRYVTVNQACEMTQVSRRTMYNWMNQGRVAYVLTAGRTRRVDADTLFRTAGGRPLSLNEATPPVDGADSK